MEICRGGDESHPFTKNRGLQKTQQTVTYPQGPHPPLDRHFANSEEGGNNLRLVGTPPPQPKRGAAFKKKSQGGGKGGIRHQSKEGKKFSSLGDYPTCGRSLSNSSPPRKNHVVPGKKTGPSLNWGGKVPFGESWPVTVPVFVARRCLNILQKTVLQGKGRTYGQSSMRGKSCSLKGKSKPGDEHVDSPSRPTWVRENRKGVTLSRLWKAPGIRRLPSLQRIPP